MVFVEGQEKGLHINCKTLPDARHLFTSNYSQFGYLEE